MGLKVPATSSLQWSQPSVSQSPSSSQALASAIASPSSSSTTTLRRRLCHNYKSSSLFGITQQQPSTRLYKSRSCDDLRSRVQPIRRASSANLDSLPDEEFPEENRESALRIRLSDEGNDESNNNESFEAAVDRDLLSGLDGEGGFFENIRPLVGDLEQPDFPYRDDIVTTDIARRANSVEIPLSLRIIKRKKQWQEGFVEAGESACCSVKKAFSSMVFIIRELHYYIMHVREILFYEDLQGILMSVQKEMNDSFVWLFQKVFSQTPNLMVYLMILLANYSVYSMSNNAAIAATAPKVQSYNVSTMEASSMVEDQSHVGQKFDSSVVKTFKVSPSSSASGKSTSVGGNNNGGGGKYTPVLSGTDGNDRSDESNYYKTIARDAISSRGGLSETITEDSTSRQYSADEEAKLWESMIDEAHKMQGDFRGKALDVDTTLGFVSPIVAYIEAEDSSEYFRTELLYQTGLTQEPENPLLLANYAQFLYLVAQDYDRAEEYFKRAMKVEPKDAEAFNKYANFLWLVRKDLWAAEETYLEAIAVEPQNSYYAANYAHFLWNTGGEDTCFPLDSSSANDV